MRKIDTIIIMVLFSMGIFAQTPELMTYQAIIRNADGQLVTNQEIGMQISILQGSDIGEPVYVETQTSFTNDNGLITLEIGVGATSDIFSDIDWLAGPYFIKTETDPTGGASYSITGISQLLSVPYALLAKTVEDIPITGDEVAFDSWDKNGADDFDGSYNSLVNKPDLGVYLIDEIDGSITNEIQEISISNDTIYLSASGFVKLPASSTFSGSFNDLTNVPANLDTDDTDDFDGAFSSLTAVPAGLSDGDDDTQLSEAEVDTYVANNGYLSVEVDGSTTNEIELPSQTGNSGKYLTTNGSSPSWAVVSSGGVASDESGLKIIRGEVNSSGTKLYGSGFTSSGSGGSYTITFSSAFSAMPTVVATLRATDHYSGIEVASISTTGCTIYTTDTYNEVLYAQGLTFIVIGPE
jgi:hypothetical protein